VAINTLRARDGRLSNCYIVGMSGVEPTGEGHRDFATTHWSIVVAAGNQDPQKADEALAQLCEAYWYPLYAYVRRRTGSIEDAQDLTQAFFAKLFEHRLYAAADPERGRFRAFLLTACKHFLTNEWHKARSFKRGGRRRILSLDFEAGESRYSAAAIDPTTGERLFERQWAMTLLERVLERLRAEYAAKSRLRYFDTLKSFLAGAPAAGGYAEPARTLGLSETTAKVAAHRLRKRYRELLRDEILTTVRSPAEIDDEIRDLFAALQPEK
jgi:RNA polymerase sigma-70 factor (ECF subfamily)